ncbi:hypothetical protein [Thermotalea metallivorans]|uniref:Uncharacterized protein n=1 Tax=Thermotalea metallivorans TaxID=520762 RepID=A0A140L5W8_9FIRM|nr:hypothetical protein [Thermotalea metallivorans]KXG75943.1 hypothetical protein AN619_14060 [Thermotalea metallivorans]
MKMKKIAIFTVVTMLLNLAIGTAMIYADQPPLKSKPPVTTADQPSWG